MDKIVDIADFEVSKNPNCTLVTRSLGSCIALAVWDPVIKIGGILHYMLPDSAIFPEKAQANPCMFANTGVPLLFQSYCALGAEKRRTVVKVAGGAQLIGSQDTFDAGRRNYLVLKEWLWQSGVMIGGEDVGGCGGRTMLLEIGTGRVRIRSNSREYQI